MHTEGDLVFLLCSRHRKKAQPGKIVDSIQNPSRCEKIRHKTHLYSDSESEVKYSFLANTSENMKCLRFCVLFRVKLQHFTGGICE